MKDKNYWKKHYVLELDAEEIEKKIQHVIFISNGKTYELIYFEKSQIAPNILISEGSGGHAYVFAELGYLMHLNGYNVFIMPKHGAATITELILRHEDALTHIAKKFSQRIGVFAEGLGGYAVFYLALANGLMKSMVLQNSPAILTENKFREAFSKGEGAGRRRKLILPFAKFLVKIFPHLPLPISMYLNYQELIDSQNENLGIETHLVTNGYLRDPDFNKWNTLASVISLVTTPLPCPLSDLKIPTMFIVPVRGIYPDYEKDLFNRLPDIKKKIIEVDGSVFWMVSHPKKAANVICDWFKETL